MSVLRKEWDELAKKNPDRLNIKYVLDKAPWGWKGASSFSVSYADRQVRLGSLTVTCSPESFQRETTRSEHSFVDPLPRSSRSPDPRMDHDKET